jgi:hypothetical protein
MNVAILFENSGTIRSRFAAAGHFAVSYDLLPTETPCGPGERHVEGDIFAIEPEHFAQYDLIIAHPTCTYLAVSGNAHHAGTERRAQAARDVAWVWDLPVEKLAIENPVGQINRYNPHMPKPFYVQPFEFGHPESKKTGWWTRGLPRLKPTNVLDKPECGYWDNQTPSGQNKLGPSADRWKIRSKTYEGIADAIVDQWGVDVVRFGTEEA